MSFFQLLTLALIACSFQTLVVPFATSDTVPEGRIIGGHKVDIIQHPHQISLRFKDILNSSKPFAHRCGGSIIADNWILTAAHCIIAMVPSQFIVVAGTNFLRGNDGIVVRLEEIFMNEKYNPITYDFDIALLKLSTPLPLNNFTMRAIKLGEQVPLNDTLATVTGWGTTTPGGYPSDELLAVQVPIVSNTICDEDYVFETITDRMLCAGLRGVGGKDACQGDSGGPLIIRDRLYGVVSWGYGCAQPAFPGVYASVPYFVQWIKEIINQN